MVKFMKGDVAFKKRPNFLQHENRQRTILIVSVIAYIVSVHWFASYLSNANCDHQVLPTFILNVLTGVSDCLFGFLEKHRPYAPRLDCFKLVVAFGFLLSLPLVLYIVLFHWKGYVSEAMSTIESSFSTGLVLAFFLFPNVILMPMIFLYNDASKAAAYGSTDNLYANINWSFAQANRAVLAILGFFVCLVLSFAYFRAFVLMRKKG